MRIRRSAVLAVLAAIVATALAAPAGASAAALRYDTAFGFKGPAGLYAYGVEYDETSDTILVSDYWNYRVKRFNKDTGALLKTFGQGIGAPYDVEVDQAGNVWVAYQQQSVVAEYTQGGSFIRKIGLGGTPNYARGCGGGKMTSPPTSWRTPTATCTCPTRAAATSTCSTRTAASSCGRSIPAAGALAP